MIHFLSLEVDILKNGWLANLGNFYFIFGYDLFLSFFFFLYFVLYFLLFSS